MIYDEFNIEQQLGEEKHNGSLYIITKGQGIFVLLSFFFFFFFLKKKPIISFYIENNRICGFYI